MRERLLPVLAFAVLAGTMLYAMRERAGRRPQVVQPPIPFSHKTHLVAGLTCATCHAQAETEAVAGIPSVTDCLDCHTAVGVQTPTLGRVGPQLEQMAARGEEIPWKQVYRVPGHVYFSHRRHVTLAQLDCALCHGDLSQVTAPVVRQAAPLTMGRCLECHRQRQVTTDCLACHR